MKLISLYIENFGGLSQYALDFQDGITEIQEPNGFGKTTLAEFIRAMFYGFPRKGKFLEKDRRQRYTPWNGAKAGGNLVFEQEGTRYRIERTFGAEPKGDTFKLIDLTTGKKSSRYSKEIGIELFKLDADSFERSTYLPQLQEQGPLTTAGIQAKLSDLVEDPGDVGNFDKAIGALKSKRSGFIPYRGSGGTVAEARNRITRLQQELDHAEYQKELLKQSVTEIEQLEQAKKQKEDSFAVVREQITRASEGAARAAIRRQHEELADRHQQIAGELETLLGRYPNGIPQRQETEAARELADRLAMLSRQEITTQADQEAQQFLKENSHRFDHHIPHQAELEEVRRKCDEYAALTARMEHTAFSEADRKQYESLLPLFKSGALDENKLDALSEQRRQLLRQKAALENLPQEERQPMPPRPGVAGMIVSLILGLTGVAAGIGLLITQNLLPGSICLSVGLLALAVGILLGAKRRSARKRYSEFLAIHEKRAAMAASVEAAEAALRRELNISDFDKGISQLRLARERFLDLQAKKAAAEEETKKLGAGIAALRQELTDFLRPYFNEAIPERFGYLLTRLERDAEGYTRALGQLEQWQERKRHHEQELHRCKKELHEFFHRYGLELAADVRSQLQQMQSDEGLYQEGKLREAQLARQLDAFRAEYAGILEVPEEEQPDLEGLKLRERQLGSEITALTGKILEQRQEYKNLQIQADRIPQLRDELEQWQEKMDDDRKKSQTLDETMEFLQKAKDSLSTSYLGPIRRNFSAYLERLTGRKEQILVNPDLEVQLERQGQARELAYFSAGQTDTIMLCMRLALVDALFPEKMFVILDDPFVNLDDERTAEALNLLKELGKERQIIYLTCSTSRSL